MGIIHLVRTQNVPKNSFLPPDIHKRVRISGGGVGWEGGVRNVRFSEILRTL